MRNIAQLLQDQSTINHFVIALYYNRAGMHEEALTWLEDALAFHDPNMPYAFLPSEMDNLRSDPRYAELANQMNLPFDRNYTPNLTIRTLNSSPID